MAKMTYRGKIYKMRLEEEIEKNIRGMIAVTIKEKFNDLWVKEFLFTFIKYIRTKNQGSPTNGANAKKYQKGSVRPKAFTENRSTV